MFQPVDSRLLKIGSRPLSEYGTLRPLLSASSEYLFDSICPGINPADAIVATRSALRADYLYW